MRRVGRVRSPVGVLETEGFVQERGRHVLGGAPEQLSARELLVAERPENPAAGSIAPSA